MTPDFAAPERGTEPSARPPSYYTYFPPPRFGTRGMGIGRWIYGQGESVEASPLSLLRRKKKLFLPAPPALASPRAGTTRAAVFFIERE